MIQVKQTIFGGIFNSEMLAPKSFEIKLVKLATNTNWFKNIEELNLIFFVYSANNTQCYTSIVIC